MLRCSLLISEARGRGLVWWQGWVVMMVVGLVRGRRWVAVVVVGWMVWGWLLHAGIARLMTHVASSLDQSVVTLIKAFNLKILMQHLKTQKQFPASR